MKKKLGVLVLTLSSLVISAACATRASSQPSGPQTDSGEAWAKTGSTQLPGRHANAAAATARLASVSR